MKIEIITDIQMGKEIWEALSPGKTIDQDWNYRYTFFHYFPHKIHFITAFEGDDPVALLPLQFNSTNSYYEFFGGSDTDDNIVFTKDGYESCQNEIFKHTKLPLHLEYLLHPYEYQKRAELQTNKYYLDLSQYKSFDDHIDRYWQGKSRLKFKRNLRNVLNRNNVEVADNAPGDIELLFKLNKQRFGTASNFHKSHREDMYRELITKFHAEVTSVEVNGNTAAVALGILYNDTYVQMNMGVDTSIDYLGKFLIGNQIDKAIRLGAQLYDAGRYDVGWKESFHLYKIPQYKLVL